MVSRSDGSPRARFVLIGEAYGALEATLDRPFVGPSYRDYLQRWWADVGLSRADFFIFNAWDQGQPANINAISQVDMQASFERGHQLLATLDGPDGGGPIIIVPTGNYALYMLTGLGKVHWHMKDGRHPRPGIYDWRGSILQYEDRRGRAIKVIPTIHPANLFRSPAMEWLCQMDWARIASDGQFRELRHHPLTKMVGPSKGEVVQWVEWTRAEAEKRKAKPFITGRLACSLDVETPKKIDYELRQKESTAKNGKCRECGHTKQWHREIERTAPEDADGVNAEASDAIASSACTKKGDCDCTGFLPQLSDPRNVKVGEEPYLGCVGYAWNPELAMCVPTTLDYWQDPATYAVIVTTLRDFHADSNVDFGGQNFPFDGWWCAEEKIPLWALSWDLMKMHRVQRPWSTDHDLATQASVDTRYPFWKHEAKTPDEISKWSHNKEQLWAYNCVDNAAQIRLLPIRYAALIEGGRWGYYVELEHPIDNGLLELSRTGFRTDEAGRAAEFAACQAEMLTVGAELNAIAGCAIIGKGGGVSNDKLKKYLYGNGVGTAVWEKPLVENTSKAAKCVGCGHARDVHLETLDEAVRGVCTKITKKLPCVCLTFIAPTKPGKRVKTGETFSGGLQLPVQYTKGPDKKKHVSANVVVIKRLMEQYPTIEKLQLIGKKVLRHRRLMVLSGFLKDAVVVGGRHFALFKQDTLLGRLSSSETPKGDGRNLQNIDRKLRQFYLPDTGEER